MLQPMQILLPILKPISTITNTNASANTNITANIISNVNTNSITNNSTFVNNNNVNINEKYASNKVPPPIPISVLISRSILCTSSSIFKNNVKVIHVNNRYCSMLTLDFSIIIIIKNINSTIVNNSMSITLPILLTTMVN